MYSRCSEVFLDVSTSLFLRCVDNRHCYNEMLVIFYRLRDTLLTYLCLHFGREVCTPKSQNPRKIIKNYTRAQLFDWDRFTYQFWALLVAGPQLPGRQTGRRPVKKAPHYKLSGTFSALTIKFLISYILFDFFSY